MWISDSSILFTTPPAVETPLSLGVSVLGSEGNGTNLFDYVGVNVSGVSQAGGHPTAGGGNVTLQGHFGTIRTISVLIGSTSCTPSAWVAETSFHCTVPPGTGSGHAIAYQLLTRAVLANYSLAALYSYDRPLISAITLTNVPITGNVNITIIGKDFGTTCSPWGGCSRTVEIGGSACKCTTWLSDSSLSCQVGAGYGAGRVVSASIDGLTSTDVDWMPKLSFDAPNLTAIMPSPVANYGNASVTIVGSDFAPFPPGPAELAVQVGPSQCSNVAWLSLSALLCRVPPASSTGQTLVTVTIAGAVSAPLQWQLYRDAPDIVSVVPYEVPRGSVSVITVVGNSFLPDRNETVSVQVGAVSCTAVLPLLDTAIVCQVAPLGAGPWSVSVIVGSLVSQSLVFLYAVPPVVTSVDIVQQAFFVGSPITIMGRSFGNFSASQETLNVLVGPYLCLKGNMDLWISDTSLQCNLNRPTLPATARVVVVESNGLTSAPFSFSMLDGPPATALELALAAQDLISSVAVVNVNMTSGAEQVAGVSSSGFLGYAMAGVDPVLARIYLVDIVSSAEGDKQMLSTVDAHSGQRLSRRAFFWRGGSQGVSNMSTVNQSGNSWHDTRSVINLEFDPQSRSLVGLQSGGTTQLPLRLLRIAVDDGGVDSCEVLRGSVRNGSAVLYLKALDPWSGMYYTVLAERQQLLAIRSNASGAFSMCENAGGVCQVMSNGRAECVYMSDNASAEAAQAASQVCVRLGLNECNEYDETCSCNQLTYLAGARLFMVKPPGSDADLDPCAGHAALFGPILAGVRAMTFDVEQRRLVVVREDVLGVFRLRSDDSFQVLMLDVSELTAAYPTPFNYDLRGRRLLMTTQCALGATWECINTIPMEGLDLVPLRSQTIFEFGAARVLSGILLIMYNLKMIFVQTADDHLHGLHYDVLNTSQIQHSRPVPIANSTRFMVPLQDLERLFAPSISYVAPYRIKASGGSIVTIWGSGFGFADYSAVAYIDAVPCVSTTWSSDVMLTCVQAPAARPGSILGNATVFVEITSTTRTSQSTSTLEYVGTDAYLYGTNIDSFSHLCCDVCQCPLEVWEWERTGAPARAGQLAGFAAQLFRTDSSLVPVDFSNLTVRFLAGNPRLCQPSPPSIGVDGALSYSLALFQDGEALYSVSDSGGRTALFVIVAAFINSPPALQFNPVVSICQDSSSNFVAMHQFANVSRGSRFFPQGHGLVEAGSDAQQLVTVSVLNISSDALFEQPPMIYPSGLLTFTVLPGAIGSASFRITVHDNGGLGSALPGSPPACDNLTQALQGAECNWDAGPSQTLEINVELVNTPPYFNFVPVDPSTLYGLRSVTYSDNYTVLEIVENFQAVPISILIAQDISVGNSTLEQTYQTASFIVSVVSGDATVFGPALPAINASGFLSLNLQRDSYGNVTLSVTLVDDGAHTCVGPNSFSRLLYIRVLAVNHAPTGTVNPAYPHAAVTTVENKCLASTPCRFPAVLISISAGPSDETWQILSFTTVVAYEFVRTATGALVRATTESLFAVSPEIDWSGNLTFGLAKYTSGNASLRITICDNGGTANGGSDCSTLYLAILVTGIALAPDFAVPSSLSVAQSIGASRHMVFPQFAKNISSGAEGTSGVTFVVSVVDWEANCSADVDCSQPFAVNPVLQSNGTLSFDTTADFVGSADVYVLAKSVFGGNASHFLRITFVHINEAPSWQPAFSTVKLYEDSGPALMVYARNISYGRSDPTPQGIVFSISPVQNSRLIKNIAVDCPLLWPKTIAAANISSSPVSFVLEHDVIAGNNFTVYWSPRTLSSPAELIQYLMDLNALLAIVEAAIEKYLSNIVRAQVILEGLESYVDTLNLSETKSVMFTLSYLKDLYARANLVQIALNRSYTETVLLSSAFVFPCPSANLTLQVYDDRFGNATFSIIALDDGGSACLDGVCGSDVSPPHLLDVELIYKTNAAPSFTLPQPLLLVNADSWCVQDVSPVTGVGGDFWYGTAAANPMVQPACSSVLRSPSEPYYQERVGFARRVLAGGESEVTAGTVLQRLRGNLTMNSSVCPNMPCVQQAVSFQVIPLSGNWSWVFSRIPRIDPDGTLIFALRPHAFGNVTFSAILADDGRFPPSSMGQNPPAPAVSMALNFTIAVLFANQPPHFDLSTHVVVAPIWQPRIELPLFAVNISTGPAVEAAVLMCCTECIGPMRALYSCCTTCNQLNCTGVGAGGAACSLAAGAQRPTFEVQVAGDYGVSPLFTADGWPYVRAIDGTLVMAVASPPAHDVVVTLVVTLTDSGPTSAAPVLGLMDPLPVETMGRRDTWQRNATLTVSGTDGALAGQIGRRWATNEMVWVGNESLSPRFGHAVVAHAGGIWILGGFAQDPGTVPMRRRTLLSAANSESEGALNDVWLIRVEACASPTSGQAMCGSGQLVTRHAAWAGRYSHAAAAHGGRIWVLGGAWSGRLGSNDVWSSLDGADWIMATAQAGWAARAGHSSAGLVLSAAELDGWVSGTWSESVLMVAGGSGGWGVRHDVWWSVDGITWLQRTAAADWTGRQEHGMAVGGSGVSGQRVWVGGGSNGLHVLGDVWWSDDGGGNWTMATDGAAWGGRAGHVLVACGDGLLLAGGRAWDSFGMPEADLHDVYGGLPDQAWASIDGAAWELRGVGFGGRDQTGGTCDEGMRVWVIGGIGPSGPLGDVWISDAE